MGQISYSMPIICIFEAISLPFIGALTDYTPHRKTVWLVNFGLLVTTTMLTGVLWHNYIWFEGGRGRGWRVRVQLGLA